MRSAQHWKRNAKNADATQKEKSLVVGIALALLAICAIALVVFGLDPISDTEKACGQATFMHGGAVTKGNCKR